MVEPLLADDLIRRALAEDHATDDRTTRLLGQAAAGPACGRFLAEEPFVVAGIGIAGRVFEYLDPEASCSGQVREGEWCTAGQVLAEIRAPASTLLAGERTALNLLQHLSAIATRTRRLVDAVAGTGARITHTRKTLPGMRALAIEAVVVGGGVPNRASLAEAVYWKDNHWVLLDRAGGSLAEAVRAAGDMEVWVEVETEAQLEQALSAGATRLLIDNQPPDRLAAWVRRAGPGVTVQASGGITDDTVPAYARAGAHVISLGALTHSVQAVRVRFDLLTDP